MVRALASGQLAETLAATSMPVFFVEIDNPTSNTYLWSGLGSISWNSKTWLGAGKFLALSGIAEANRTQAQGVTGVLNGVDPTLLTTVLTNLRRYQPVKIWLGALNSSFAVISTPYQIFNGRVDTATVSDDGKTAAISVTAENRLIALTIPKERRYTDKDQRIERPSDGGFKFVAALQDSNIEWNGAVVLTKNSIIAGLLSGTSPYIWKGGRA